MDLVETYPTSVHYRTFVAAGVAWREINNTLRITNWVISGCRALAALVTCGYQVVLSRTDSDQDKYPVE